MARRPPLGGNMYETRWMRWLRWKYHISHRELARCAGVCRQRIVQIELAEEKPTQNNLQLIQKGFARLIESREAALRQLKQDVQKYGPYLLADMGTQKKINEGDTD